MTKSTSLSVPPGATPRDAALPSLFGATCRGKHSRRDVGVTKLKVLIGLYVETLRPRS